MNTTTRFQHFLRPPHFDDPEVRFRARILHYFLWFALIIQFLLMLAQFVTGFESRRLISAFISLSVLSTSMFMLRRGRVALTSKVLVALLWLVVAGSSLASGGLDSPVFFGNAAIIILAGILLGPRSALTVAGTSIFLGILILTSKQLGVGLEPLWSYSLLSQWLVISAILAVIAALLLLNTNHLHEMAVLTQRSDKDRAKAVGALEESEERYRALVEVSPYTIVVHQDGILTYINQAGLDLMGADTPEEFLGKPVLDFLHPDYHAIAKDRIQQAVQNQSMLEPLAEKIIRLDGKVLDVQINGTPFSYEGKPAIQLIIRDISKELEARQTITQERDLAEALVEAATIISSSLDLDLVMDYILEQVSRVIPNDAANIMLVEEGIARIVRARGYERFGIKEDMDQNRWPISIYPTFKRMTDTLKPIIISDITEAREWRNLKKSDWLRSYAGAPIINKGQVVGFLNIDSSTPDFYSEDILQRLQAFAGLVATGIENAQLYQAVQSHADELERRITKDSSDEDNKDG